MDREILFRGKRLDNGEWVEGGYYRHHTGQIGIVSNEKTPAGSAIMDEVDPSTVGQYTGMTDKNGAKIFEGDICRVGNLTYQVVFQYSQWWFSIVDPSVYCCPYFHSHCEEHCEVIGNIHDNPELIGGAG